MANPGNHRRRAAAWLGLVLLGCGARAPVGGSGDDEEPGGAGLSGSGGADAVSAPAGTGGAATLPSDPGGPIDVGGVTLPECQLGEPRSVSGSRDCTYVVAGNCYADGEMACACACRGLADNRCIIGGFLNPDEPQTVRCTAR